jgi:NTP pyrophosphatase (non-canonical NTP hydrolase)
VNPIYVQAIEKYGRESQLVMLAEECSELAVAALHYRRGRIHPKQLLEEIADVMIMIDQALVVLSGDGVSTPHNELATALEGKLERLEQRIEEG